MIEYTPRKLASCLSLCAVIFAVSHSQAKATWPPVISERQATAFTQAHALVECVKFTKMLGAGKRYCKLQPDSWVQERCKVKNPRLPFRLYFGSWGECPFRYWVKEYNGPRQMLHGCHFVIRRSPPRFKLRGWCKPGSRFPA